MNGIPTIDLPEIGTPEIIVLNDSLYIRYRPAEEMPDEPPASTLDAPAEASLDDSEQIGECFEPALLV